MKELKVFKCKHCGNVVFKIVDKKVPVFCCGEKMQELTANTVEASMEKHLPVIKFEDDKLYVDVGSVTHPMEAEHYINFIVLQTENEILIKNLNPSEKPTATFCHTVKPIAVYEYCNLHGLWKTEI